MGGVRLKCDVAFGSTHSAEQPGGRLLFCVEGEGETEETVSLSSPSPMG